MALDTLAKRLASQEIPGPAPATTEQSYRHRWAVSGSFLPSLVSAGAIAGALGALSAELQGTFTAPPAETWVQGDRWRVEGITTPGDIGLYDRHALSDSFLFEGSSAPAGAIEITLGGLVASLRGTGTAPPNRDGRVASNLGGLAASLRGTAYYDLWFDLDWSLTPTFEFQVLPKRDGAMATTLGGLAAALRGSVLPPDSTGGAIEAVLGSLSADLLGTFVPAPARDGNLHLDFGALVASLRGTAVPPFGVQGALATTLGALSADLSGSFTAWSTTGDMELTLGALSAALRGQFIDAGAGVGLIDGNLGGLTASLRGTSVFKVIERRGRTARGTPGVRIAKPTKPKREV